MSRPYSRIAITLPPEDLAAADRLAKTLDRSRSWIVAEAIRRYAAAMESTQSTALDTSRSVQLLRDLALSAEERVRAAEEIAVVPGLTEASLETPRSFATYDEFDRWRRSRSKP